MSRTMIFIAGFVFLQLQKAHAQQDSAVFYLSRTISADISDFTVDNVGNIYIVNRNNQLKKLSPEGDSLAVYNASNLYGDIYYVDVTNPLKILVFYKDFATIVEVDRFLNIINTIDLRNLSIFQVKAVGLAYDNNIWVYDELDAKLKRVGDDGTLIDQTTDFRQLFDSIPDPSVIVDQGSLVYLYDNTKGVYIFDHYGTVKSKVSLLGWQDFTVIDKSMVGRIGTHFYKYQLSKLDFQQEPIPQAYDNAVKIKITPSSIYVLKKNELTVYARR